MEVLRTVAQQQQQARGAGVTVIKRQPCLLNSNTVLRGVTYGHNSTFLPKSLLSSDSLMGCRNNGKKRNHIAEIIDQDGNVVSSLDGVLATTSAFFSDLFKASTVRDTDSIFDKVRRCISTEQNNALIAPFAAEEVTAALRTMPPLKAPGLDESNTWNYALLQSIFPQDIADCIQCIPLASSKPRDELIWRYENTGTYSPKNGYKLLLELNLTQYPRFSEAYTSLLSSFYTTLWDLSMPAKCKIFIWRLMHNFLPTFANLQHHKLPVRNTCRLCEASADTIDHLVFSCPVSLGLLDLVGLPLAPASQQLNFAEIFATWFMQVSKKQQTLIVITYWALWYARNAIVHDGSACSTVKVSTFILVFHLELDSLADVSDPTLKVKDVKWFPPDGLIVAACSYPHSGVADVFIAEALACKTTVSFTIDLGFRLVQFEGGSLSVIKKLNSDIPDKSVISPIISDTKGASKNFELLTFSYVSRKGNEPAHELAKLGLHTVSLDTGLRRCRRR
ncbi:hypothetical protein V6N12_032960 [Hibiscus sabdariffa]|uniref:Reverse transcriptase zinc-binding domain-containing protein n=1 Tax=Hibiscus sabdariffa TaxID=183260 RepID=A0ABR2BDR7_9ROSI